jgi:hypothetical protein
MIKKFVSLFEHKLFLALEEKTSWGRTDLKLLIKSVLTDTMLELME